LTPAPRSCFNQTAVSSRGFLINAAAFVIVVAGLRAAGSIAVLLLVSAFFAMISAPAVLWLKKQRVPSIVAVLLVVATMIGIFTVLGIVLGASINSFVRATPAYRQRLDAGMGQIVEWARQVGVDELAVRQLRSIEPGAIMGILGNVFGALGGLLGNSLLILLIVLFALFEVSSFPIKLRAAFGGSEKPVERFREITGNVVHYLALKSLISLFTGLGVGIWVAVVGLDFPVLWGLLAFILNFIPNFGSLMAAIPAVMLALVQLGPRAAGIVILGYVVVNFVMANLIEPRVMGVGLGLSTLVVFLSLLAWSWILGTVGMFLAVPLTVALRIVLESNPHTHWIAVLMGPAREAARETS